MIEHSRLVKMKICNFGCIGPDGLEIALDNIIALVGPNNTGKTTVLRAYEAAVSNLSLSEDELCLNSNGQPTSVEMWVHIPNGTQSIAEKWIEPEGDLRLIQSKWSWPQANCKPIRKTWDPEIKDYADDGKASGVDAVFSSRLPVPLRIEALSGPDDEHKKLIKFILEPIEQELKKSIENKNSELSKKIAEVKAEAKKPVKEYNKTIQDIKTRINRSFTQTFPLSELILDIDMAEIDIRPMELLQRGSQIKIQERENRTSFKQQGTGSQRALFWSILEVRSELKKASDKLNYLKKREKDIPLEIERLNKEISEKTQQKAISDRKTKILELTEEFKTIKACLNGETSEEIADPLSMPGHMLLVDEPEIALHPNAIRAAKKYLYELAKDSGWQVMLSTHSPIFVDPFEDHTTIVRLTRSNKHPTPKTYRSDEVLFSPDERENLKLLLRFDTSLAEMFFGAYPIIVEGDTEYAAFLKIMDLYSDEYIEEQKPLVLRAYGKFSILNIIKILKQFKIPFSLIHDSDSPKNSKGSINNVWVANKKIYEEISNFRLDGINVIHRISVPDFERQHKLPEAKDDKPYKIFNALVTDDSVKGSVKCIFDQLKDITAVQQPFEGKFEEELKKAVEVWAKSNGKDGNVKYQFD